MNLTDSQFHAIFAEAMSILQQAQVTRLNWKERNRIVTLVCGILAFATGASIFYYIYTHMIGPLMICLACTIPIFCIAIIQQTRYLEKINTEFKEYRAAVAEMVDHLSTNLETSLVTPDLRKLIERVEKEGRDVDEIFQAIQAYEGTALDDMTAQVIDNTVALAQANIIPVTQEKLNPDAPDEDLSIRV